MNSHLSDTGSFIAPVVKTKCWWCILSYQYIGLQANISLQYWCLKNTLYLYCACFLLPSPTINRLNHSQVWMGLLWRYRLHHIGLCVWIEMTGGTFVGWPLEWLKEQNDIHMQIWKGLCKEWGNCEFVLGWGRAKLKRSWGQEWGGSWGVYSSGYTEEMGDGLFGGRRAGWSPKKLIM